MKLNSFTPYLTLILAILVLSCSRDNDTETTVDPKLENNRSLGTSARNFLSAEEFTGMRVEIAYVQGFKPSTNTLNNLRDFFTSRLNKPDGVTFKETIVPATTVGSLSREEYVKIEQDNRTVYNAGDELGVWIFFADQSSEKDEGTSRILGTAYLNTSCIIYEKTLKDFSNRIGRPNLTLLETITTQHEFGHLFGLVNLGSAMVQDHEDEQPDDAGVDKLNKHCNQKDCLMYFQTVGSAVGGSMTRIPSFGEFCLEDLRANGGK